MTAASMQFVATVVAFAFLVKVSLSFEMAGTSSATRCYRSMDMKSALGTGISRKDYITKSLFASGLVWGAQSSSAFAFGGKKEEEPPLTPEQISAKFKEVKADFEKDIFAVLQNYVRQGDWESIKNDTKFMDLEFRKAKMGGLRKALPKGVDPATRDRALELCNAVTFDLIEINKSARVADAARAEGALKILLDDVNAYLSLEKSIIDQLKQL